MNFDEYQAKALSTLIQTDDNLLTTLRMVLGLNGEAGEIAEKFKKVLRDDNGEISQKFKEDMIKELGDVLWYIVVLARLLNINLNDIAQCNIEKLAKRKAENKIKGSGDNR